MKRIMVLFLFFCSVLSPSLCLAEERPFHHLDSTGMVLGTIQGVGRNTIDIYDENDKTVKRFVYLKSASPYHAGDRVRMYYDRTTNAVRIIKKMTALDYSPNGQNLGYLTKDTCTAR